jgi:TonB-linked SusC/RagA family outer membrane protein
MQLKKLLKRLLLAVFCFIIAPAWAQNKVITGKVTDSKDGSPLPGVTVTVQGTTNASTTNAGGNYSLSVPASTTTLIFSFIGYDRQSINIAGKTVVNVGLTANNTALNEVQVISVGYGSQRKKDITGAVANLTSKNFNQGAIINPVDQLSGKVAGLQITQPGGDPNQTASIRLRGQSSLLAGLSPLFVVDGVILDDPNQFQNIPPGDIASYDVLKDASASAIYGSRGANGVILVTTKRGAAGRTSIEYNAYAGESYQSKYYDLLSASELRTAVPNLGSNDKGANTDWQKAITRTAFQQSHNVAIAGGANGFSYRGSVNYQDQQGIVLNSDKQQLGFRFTADQKALHDKLDIQIGLTNVVTNRKLFDYHNFSYMYNSLPTYPVYNPDGSYYAYSDFELRNPVMHLEQENYRTNENLTLAYATADYNLFDGFKVGVRGSTSRNNVAVQSFVPTFPVEANVNTAGQSAQNTNSYKGDIHLNYDKAFGKHRITVLGGYEFNDFINSGFLAAGQQYIIPQQQSNNLGVGNSQFNRIASYKNEFRIISFFGRAQYNYNDRIYATGTLREDGSSKFGTQYQHGYFPSFDLAYRLKKDFFSNVDWLNDLKIRAGYGVTGNQDAISPYAAIQLVGTTGQYYNAATQSYPFAYSTTQNANSQLRWEERHGRNIGLDFDLFGGRLSGDVNYFNDETKHLLANYSVPTPPFIANTILANVGTLRNKGFELALNGQIIKGSKFNWNANGQITFINTKVLSLSGEYNANGTTYELTASQIPVASAVGRGLSNTYIDYLKPGYGPYVFYLPHYTGTNANGEQTFDGKTIAENPTPQAYYTDPNPKFNYGLTNNFSYGNWNLNFALRGVYGQKIFNNTRLDIETITRLPGNNVTKEALTNGTKDAPVASDRWLENASFLRLDNASLGYTFGALSFASNMRVYLSSSNLFVITKYRGLDPEVKAENQSGGTYINGVNLNGSNNQPFIDANYGGQAYYPRTRSFILGVSLTLK